MRQRRILTAAATLLTIFGLLLTGCSGSEAELDQAVEDLKDRGSELVSGGTTVEGDTQTVTVTGIVDGDTIEVSPDATGVDTVRFLSVDTPETYGETEPLGPQAKAFTTAQLQGQRVVLEYDEDRIDPYDRALAHVTVVGQERTIQEKLLSRGLAQTAFFEPNYLYQDRLLSIQEDARQRGAGIWGLPVSKRCDLANRGNQIGEGSEECQGAGS